MIPGEEKKCGCLSGISDKQAVLVELAGMLEMVSWKVAQARGVLTTDKAAAEYLQKVEKGLERLKDWSTKRAWRPEAK